MEKRKWEKGEGPELYEKYELDALHSEKSEAMAVFYNVVPKILIAENKAQVWELYEQAREKLLVMYSTVGGQSREDFHRMDMLLLRRAWERIDGFDVNKAGVVLEDVLSRNEIREIESLQDKNMVVLVTPLYTKLVKQLQNAPREDLLKIFEGGVAAISRVYDNSPKARKDFPIWEHLLSLRYGDLAMGKKDGGGKG